MEEVIDIRAIILNFYKVSFYRIPLTRGKKPDDCS